MSLKITALTHELRLPVNLCFSKNTGNAEGQEPPQKKKREKKEKGKGSSQSQSQRKGSNENKRSLKCFRYAQILPDMLSRLWFHNGSN